MLLEAYGYTTQSAPDMQWRGEFPVHLYNPTYLNRPSFETIYTLLASSYVI